MRTLQKSTKIRNVLTLACLLTCVFSTARADESYEDGAVVDIDREVLGWIWIADATVNLKENAWVKNVYDAQGQLLSPGYVWAASGSVLNIYGGKIDELLILTGSIEPAAQVTVYGSVFAINGIPVVPGTPEVVLYEDDLSGVYESGTTFSFKVECVFLDTGYYQPIKLVWLGETPQMPQIEVTPETVEFGQVEVGAQQTAVVTVANTGNAPLTLQSLAILQGARTDFGFIPLEQLPLTIAPESVRTITVVFAPAAEGPFEAILQIAGNDAETPVVEVLLTGSGIVVVPALTPKQQIAAINAFYLEGLKDGTIVGIGPGKSGSAKAIALGHMLVCARQLIDGGYTYWALIPLWSVEDKTDGKPRPADFVQGPSVPVLNAMINQLIMDIRK